MKIRMYLLLLSLPFVAQEVSGQWDQYEAVWKGKPGTMLVNMDMMEIAPIPSLVYFVEITKSVLECDEDGYPSHAESRWSDIIASRIDSLISIDNYAENVGRLTYQCEIKEYYYIQDTLGLNNLITKNFSVPINLKIVEDKEWKVYRDFIYPDDYLIQTMDNRKIIKVLQREGYDLDVKSTLTHFASFGNELDRNKFRRFLIEQNFKIHEQQYDDARPLPHLISFTRRDKLQLEQLSNITLRIWRRTKSLNGTYDGWEIEI